MRFPTLLFEFRSSAAAHVCAVSVLLGLVTGLCLGQEAERTPLNSERIEARYGSYGIEVLESDTRIRESNLFSEHAGGRVTRTFAIVQYPEIVHSEFSDEIIVA